MTAWRATHERLYRGLLHLYPAEFRARFSEDVVQLFGDQLREARIAGGMAAIGSTWLKTIGDLVVTAASEHMRRNRTVAHSLAAAPSTSSRALGVAGVVGGAVLLAAIVIGINPEINWLRLALFNVGAIAIVIGTYRLQASVSPGLALAAAVPAVLANAWYLVMVILDIDRAGQVGAGGFGIVFFYADAAMWLSDTAFGLVTGRLGVMWRWAAFALAIGSVLALTGMDRLALTSAANPTIFGPLSLIGIALNGLGWIGLGIELATRRRPAAAS